MLKNVKALQEERDQLQARALGIVELAKTENRELSADEQTEVDGIINDGGKLERIERDIVQAKKLEQIQAKLLAEKVKTGEVSADRRPDKIVVPATARKTGHLKAFKNEETAYSMGQWLAATIYGNASSRQWCQDRGLISNAMTTGDNNKGGFLVPEPLEAALIELRQQYGIFRRYAASRPMTDGVSNEPKRLSGTTVYYIGEGTASTDGITASDMAIGNVRLEAKTAAIMTVASRVLVADAVINLAERLAVDMAAAFSEAEDNAGFNGDGSSTYGGIVGAKNVLAAGSIADALSGNTSFDTLDLADFRKATAKWKRYTGAVGRWYISSSGYSDSMERLMDAGGGNTNGTLANGAPQFTFMGYEVVFTEVLNSTLTAQPSTILAYFGDLSQAAMFGDRQGVEIDVDSSLYFKQNALAIRGIERYDINVHDRGSATAGGALIAVKTAAS